MTELEISVAGGPGWRTLRYGAVHGLVGDDLPPAVAEELDALGSAESAPSLDDVVDAHRHTPSAGAAAARVPVTRR